jgi:hypothetical protein
LLVFRTCGPTFDVKKKDDPTHLSAPLQAHDFPFNKPEADAIFEIDTKSDPIVIVQRPWSFSDKLEAMPYAGIPGFMTCASGFLWVTLVDLSSLADKELTIDNISMFLSKTTVPEFDKFFSAVLTPGKSIWVPMQFVPICVAIGDENDKDSDMKMGSYYFMPVLDTLCLVYVSPIVLSEMKAFLTRGLEKKLKCVAINGKAISAWVSKFNCDKNEQQKIDAINEFDASRV